MKRFIVAAGVFGIFMLYSLGMRHETPTLPKPASLSEGSASPSPLISNNSAATPPAANAARYKDGTYTGTVADAYYGSVQVKATISGGKLTNVTFLQYPDTHSTSIEINSQAMPYLQQEAIQAQSADVQVVSGATFTSQAFTQSLSSALSQA